MIVTIDKYTIYLFYDIRVGLPIKGKYLVIHPLKRWKQNLTPTKDTIRYFTQNENIELWIVFF